MMNPEIMLFGTKIILPESGRVVAGGEYSGESCVESSDEKQENADEDQEEELYETTKQDENQNPIVTDENPKTPSINEYDTSKTENEQSGGSSTNGQPKSLKKPDKILPCPRCNSTDTKFCYFNNYNVKQPRHFCKACQRYWTAGGTMRNVPVGAGRRKSKNYYASQYRHLTISESQIETSNGLPHMKLKSDGSVLSFGPDSPKRNPNGFQSPLVPFTYPAIYPMPYYYTQPVWNCNVPFPTVNQSPLGKHSRNEDLLIKTNNSESKEPKRRQILESSVVVPKTLRIDDPEEAAKSSIWSTLGIENRDNLLKALQNRGEEKKLTVNASPLLLANPAALSRSISFQERI